MRLLPGLYRRLAQTLQTSDAGAAALIAFAGGAAYRFAAARRFALGQNLSEIDFNLLQEFIEAVGEQETRSFCDSLAAIDPELHAYVLRVWEATRVPAAPKRPVDRPLDYAGFRDWLDSAATVQPPGLRRSATEPPSELLARIAADVATEARPEALVKLLKVFSRHAYPLDPSALIACSRHPQAGIRFAALQALRLVCAPAVRERGLELASDENFSFLYPGLLARNFQAGDERILLRLLKAHAGDDDYWHRIGFEIRDFFEENADADIRECLLALYEFGPCQMCRHAFVKGLVERRIAPDWLLHECRYDCDEMTRAIATAVLKPSG